MSSVSISVITAALLFSPTAFEESLEDRIRHGAHQLANLPGVEMRAAIRADGCAGDGLVHDGERVAHGAVAGLGEQGERGLVGVELFVVGDRAQLREDVVEAHGVES